MPPNSVVNPQPDHFVNLDPNPHQIRIRSTGSASNKNQDLDLHPDPHQSDKLVPALDPDPLQFADDKPKCMEYEPI
jgi:hypothetical protein